MPVVYFEDDDTKVTVKPGTLLLEAAERAGVMLSPDCHFGWCGSDPLIIVDGMESLSPPEEDEQDNLDFNHFPKSVRMACVTRVFGDVVVHKFNA